MKKSLALFDFDGTITYSDSFIDFTHYAVGTWRMLAGFLWLAPVVVLFYLKLIGNDNLKAIFLTHFFNGWSSDRFEQTATQFSQKRIPRLVKRSALKQIQWHQEQEHDIYVVSASLSDWLRPWCQKQDLKLISTELEKKEDNITGKLKTPNCHGKEKVNRIKAEIDLAAYETIYAYGDSSGDHAMLEIADKKHYRYFK